MRINGTTVVDEYVLCSDRNTDGWVGHNVDLTAYAGQSVAVQIRAETDSNLFSSLYVDDVAFRSAPLPVTSIRELPITPGSISTKSNNLSPEEKNK